MTSVRHFSDLARDFSSSRPSRSAGVLARWLSALTSPLGAMLSPLSAVLDGSSTMDGSDAITFMSGSGATGSTISGSSPGCQRSMFSGEPSDELPKNRLEVLNEKPSRGSAGATASMVSGALFISSSGWASSDIDTSKCASGGALSASANSGSSLAGSGAGMAAAVFAPITDALEVDGSSLAGAAASLDAGATVSGDTVTSRSPFNVRSTLGKSE